ncbi:hypothetical protein V5O48_006702 [Marasmius crinis-equi]|uniref:Uncharacterized protein n=1 Tax=Marasmius crinis-equi TaxID=585013 RepID=A0ABR3FIT4_9AGAR
MSVLHIDEKSFTRHSEVPDPFPFNRVEIDCSVGHEAILFLDTLSPADLQKIQKIVVFTSSREDPNSQLIRTLAGMFSALQLHLHPVHADISRTFLNQTALTSLTLHGALHPPLNDAIALDRLTVLAIIAPDSDNTVLPWVDRYIKAKRLRILSIAADLTVETNVEYIPYLCSTFGGALRSLRIRDVGEEATGFYRPHNSRLFCLWGLPKLTSLTIQSSWVIPLLHHVRMRENDFSSLRELILEEEWSVIDDKGVTMRRWDWRLIAKAIGRL